MAIIICPDCKGEGTIIETDEHGKEYRETCPVCDGNGEIDDEEEE